MTSETLEFKRIYAQDVNMAIRLKELTTYAMFLTQDREAVLCKAHTTLGEEHFKKTESREGLGK